MVTFKQISISAVAAVVLLSGCAQKQSIDEKAKNSIVQKELQKVQEHNQKQFEAPLPPLSLPPVYEEPTILGSDKKISFSATDAPLSKLLYVLAQEAGLNLVVDENVNVNKLITINMQDASLQDALDITMNITDSYVELKGNILHVKNVMTRSFELPFINMSPTTSSELGGDLLGSNGAGSLAGDYSMSYESDDDNGNFYLQLEESIAGILSEEGKFSINKFSGSLVVTDKRKNVEEVEKVVKNLKKFLSKQILIEAKVMEVILNDGHQLGVNWQKAWQNINSGQGTLTLGSNLSGNSGTLSQTPNIAGGNAFNSAIGTAINGAIATSMSYTTGSLESIIQAMETAGTVEVVSNPRIKVMNGQSGVLASGNVVPYWEKEVTYVQTTQGNTTTTTPEITYNKTDVLNGISLGVTPIIQEDGDVVLNVVPVITTIDGEKVLTDANGEAATAPIINIKQAGTTVITKHGDMVVIGGLISTRKTSNENKIPYLGDVPVAGNLFKNQSSSYEKRELVIILKIDVDERKL
jgi:MSHA biogenesis protein MshL